MNRILLRIAIVLFPFLLFHLYTLTNVPHHLMDCPSSKVNLSIRAPTGQKVLVTGVAGFIGSHVAKDCLDLGFEVIGVDDMSGGFRRNVPNGVSLVIGDLKDASFVSKLMEKERFDLVYHLAAYAANLRAGA